MAGSSDISCQIRTLQKAEIAEARHLVLEVFMIFEAPDYSEDGIAHFKSYIRDADSMHALAWHGAFVSGKLVGILATRNRGTHISLFFVQKNCQNSGIGRALFAEAKTHCTAAVMTVNASPYAVDIYRRLGFTQAKKEQLEDGLRFTPMTCPLHAPRQL